MGKTAIEYSEKTNGFKCTCGKSSGFAMYVAAHSHNEINYTCPKCKKKWTIIEYMVYEDSDG